jgi:hypothetical protein
MTANVILTKTFTTAKGTTITVTGTLVLEKEVWLDGDTFTTSCCDLLVNVYAPGHGDQGGDVRKLNTNELRQVPAGYTHKVGQLGLTTEQAELIKSVYTELKQHSDWIALQARISANEKADAEYQAHVRRVDDMMTLGGKTY